jgi:hypothetical protein
MEDQRFGLAAHGEHHSSSQTDATIKARADLNGDGSVNALDFMVSPVPAVSFDTID